MDFKSFIERRKQLEENSLYKTPQERQAIVADKAAVADIFVYNFLGILGLINGVSRAPHVAKLQAHFKKEKQVQIQSIGDDNHDMSIAVKLAKEAGFFKNDLTVSNITKFLAKLKLGQVTEVNSSIVADWLDNMTPEFFRSISDTKIRQIVNSFHQDKGVNIDLSRIAIESKKKANRIQHAGEFKELAKVVKVDEKLIGTNAPAATTTTTTTAAPKVANAPKAAPPVAPIVPSPAPVPVKKEMSKKIDLTTYSSEYTMRPIWEYLMLGAVNSSLEEEYRKKMRSSLSMMYPPMSDSDVEIIEERMKLFLKDVHDILKLDVPNVKTAMEDLTRRMIDTGIFSGNQDDLFTSFRKHPFSDKIDEVYGFNKLRYLIIYLCGINSSITSLKAKDILDITDYIYNSNLGNASEYTTKHFLTIFSYQDLAKGSGYFYGTLPNNVDMQISTQAISAKMSIQGDKIDEIYSKADYNLRTFIEQMFRFMKNIDSMHAFGYPTIVPVLNALHEAQKSPRTNTTTLGLIIDALYNNLDSGRGNGSDLHPALLEATDKIYKEDILNVGLANSLFMRDTEEHQRKLRKFMFDRWGFTTDFLKQKFPGDKAVIKVAIDLNGTDTASPSDLLDYAEYKAFSDANEYRSRNDKLTFDQAHIDASFYVRVASNMKGLYGRTMKDSSTLADGLALAIEKHKDNFNNGKVFKEIMHLFQSFEREGNLAVIRAAKNAGMTNFFDPSLYTDTGRRAEKEEFVSILTSVMNDAIGSDVEDYFSDVLDNMPGGVIGRIRGNLVGFKKLVDEANAGTIKPFATIDAKRLREMLKYNDINPNALINGETPRRKRKEKWTDYFKRAKEELDKKPNVSFLGAEKVSLDKAANPRALTATYNKSFRTNNNHGDTYVKIMKTYDADVKFPQFDEFRKDKYGDGSVKPAFHGTGGIAATMILRYGFTVIKSTDSSVAGRMLGDGIYFSNKIDKALQYVGNSGFGRRLGTKGYIFELDTNLGKSPTNYRAMGLGNDHIRSPEWCVYDPKAQLAIVKAHEVEFSNKEQSEKYAKETVTEGLVSFKKFMTENVLLKKKDLVTAFVFRDGLIPIPKKNGRIDYIDFEDVIKQKMVPAGMIDYSQNGPVVVFKHSKKNYIHDIRYADTMNGIELDEYKENFFREVKS